MNKFLLLLALIVFGNFFVLATSLPPSPFIDRGACPFECCKYGSWIVKSDIELLDRIDGMTIVGRIQKGEKVEAISGEVHTVPTEVEVIKRRGKFRPGDIFYLLTNQGEGFYRIWYKGNIFPQEVLFPEFTKSYNFKNCNPKKTKCWGNIKNLNRTSIWWVKVKNSKGKIGWTKRSKEFSGQDSCS